MEPKGFYGVDTIRSLPLVNMGFMVRTKSIISTCKPSQKNVKSNTWSGKIIDTLKPRLAKKNSCTRPKQTLQLRSAFGFQSQTVHNIKIHLGESLCQEISLVDLKNVFWEATQCSLAEFPRRFGGKHGMSIFTPIL
jgi:hypothetical protein